MEHVIRSLPQAYRIIKEMNLFGDGESDYQTFSARVIAADIRGQDR